MNTTIYNYFWKGIVYGDQNIPPYLSSKFYGIEWIPPKGMKINTRRLFTHEYKVKNEYYSTYEYVKSLTKHGKVVYNYYDFSLEWNKDEDTLTILLTNTDLKYRDAKRLAKTLDAFGREYRYVNDQHIALWFYPYYVKNRTYNIIVDIDNNITPRLKTVLDHKTVIYLQDIRKNIDSFTKKANSTNKRIVSNAQKYIKSINANSKYTIDDLLQLGDLYIQYNRNNTSLMDLNSYEPNSNKYILSLREMDDPDKPFPRELVIRNKTYTPNGDVIFQLVSYYINESKVSYYIDESKALPSIINKLDYFRIVDVVLIGKEYTGQWWMHHLPPFYANSSIQSCERWIMGISKEDTIIKES